MSSQFKQITREAYKSLLDCGWTGKPAGLYEPDHNPTAMFVIIKGLGLYRLYAPKELEPFLGKA